MTFRLSLRRRRERGLNLMEIAITLVALTFMAQQIMSMLSENARTLKAQGDAEKLRTITETAERYLAAYEDQLLVQTAGGTVAIPIGRRCSGCSQPASPGSLPTVQDAGFLPEMFVDTNSNQQSHALLVKQTPSGKLEALITTYGGAAMSDEDVGYVAGLLGAAGGGVFNNAAIGPTDEISGVHGGWGDTTGNWNASIGGTNVRPSSGTVQVSLGLADVAGLGIVDEAKFLHREAETDPTLNSMETDLHMDGDGTPHNIDGAANLSFQTGNASGDITAGGDVRGATLRATNSVYGGQFIDTNNTTYRANPSATSRLNNINANDLNVGDTDYRDGVVDFDGAGAITGNDLNINGGGQANFNKPINARQGIHNGGGDLRLNDNTYVNGNLEVRYDLDIRDIDVRDIDVRHVTASGNLRGNDIRGGYMESTGTLRGDYVRSDGNMYVADALTVQNDINARQDVEVTRDVNAGRNIEGQNIRASNDVHVGDDLFMNGSGFVKGTARFQSRAVFNDGANFGDRIKTTGLYFTSDRRLKTDIEDIDGDMINKLRPRSFTWKKDGTSALGFIAQEVEKEFPDLVDTDEETGMKAVKYTDMIAPLVAKAQSTDDEIEELTERIEALEAAR